MYIAISVAIVACVFLLCFAFFVHIQKVRYAKHQSYTMLEVQVAKGEEKAPGPIAAEQFFSTLHTIDAERSFWDLFTGRRPPRISFEIANKYKRIKFYLWFPSHYRNLIEGQIYAQYPNVEIREVPDYTSYEMIEIQEQERNVSRGLVRREDLHKLRQQAHFKQLNMYKHAIGAELLLDAPEVYPIKRYPQFEDKLTRVAVDPLAAITASLAQLHHQADQIWLQVVVRPIDDSWRARALTCLRIITKGIFLNIEVLQDTYANIYMTRKKWIRLVFFPLYMFFWVQGLLSGSKKSISLNPLSAAQSEDEAELVEEMSRSHERETDMSAAMDKISKLAFEIVVRVVYVPNNPDALTTTVKVQEVIGSFKQFAVPHVNEFSDEIIEGAEIVKRFRSRELDDANSILNVEELATIYHLPGHQVQTPNIDWVRSRKLEPPSDLPDLAKLQADGDITMVGKTNFRGQHEEFGIKTEDRRRHMYIIGKTGMGKSTLLENMIYADIRAGKGVGVVDPHGDLADRVIDFIPSNRTNDVIIFDPSDRDFPLAFNMLENVDPSYNTIVASGLVGIFKRIYGESWGPRLEHILRNTILALLEYPNTTMLGITRMLQDADFRHRVIKKISDPVVKSFWINEFEKLDPRMRMEAISPILNKVGQFLSSPIIRNIVGQPQSTLDLRFAMDRKKIIIVNLSKGKIGEDNSSLLGAMMITKFQLDAMSRADIAINERIDFYLYVDEFQNFATDSFATILSEARKYKLNLTMANQYIAQMAEEVAEAVFGNVGSLVSFQVGFDDAEKIAGQFGDEELVPDLVALQIGNVYLRLLVDGMPTKVFSATTFSPSDVPRDMVRREKIIRASRERYTKKRDIVEDKIRRWSESAQIEPPAPIRSSILRASDPNGQVGAPKGKSG